MEDFMIERQQAENDKQLQDKKGFIAWVKAHKKELALAGISIVAINAVIIGIRNKTELCKVMSELKSLLSKPRGHSPVISTKNIAQPVVAELTVIDSDSVEHLPFDVRMHLRNLHKGRQASAKKIATAAEKGYILGQGQTWVEPYTKSSHAA